MCLHFPELSSLFVNWGIHGQDFQEISIYIIFICGFFWRKVCLVLISVYLWKTHFWMQLLNQIKKKIRETENKIRETENHSTEQLVSWFFLVLLLRKPQWGQGTAGPGRCQILCSEPITSRVGTDSKIVDLRWLFCVLRIPFSSASLMGTHNSKKMRRQAQGEFFKWYWNFLKLEWMR